MKGAGQRLHPAAAKGTGAPVVREADGAFALDAGMLAGRFGWSPPELREMMRRGLVSSLVERGEGDDAGTWRLTVRCGNRRWRAVVAADGSISEHGVDFVTRRGSEASP